MSIPLVDTREQVEIDLPFFHKVVGHSIWYLSFDLYRVE